GGDKILPTLCGIKEDSPVGAAISKRRQEIFKERYLPSLRPTRGAEALLRRLRERGLRLHVASSAKQDELRGLLKVCGAEDLIGGRPPADDAERSKPAPAIVGGALDDLALPPAQVVMLGDTPYDVEAACRAGVRIIALRCGGWGDPDLAGAAAV